MDMRRVLAYFSVFVLAITTVMVSISEGSAAAARPRALSATACPNNDKIYHVQAQQDIPSGVHGLGARLTISTPVVKDRDGWSLAQLLIGDPSIGVIEFGWIVTSDDSKLHLFL